MCPPLGRRRRSLLLFGALLSRMFYMENVGRPPTSDVPKGGGARGPWPLPERPQGAPQAPKYFFLTLDKTFNRNKN